MREANRFPNPNVVHFFEQKGAVFDKDSDALSEMIQFIWCSAIRDGKAIDVYIPSSRMRKLLYNWLETGW